MNVIDTHVHLDVEAFEGDFDEVIARSRSAGVSTWINVGFNPERWISTAQIVESMAGMYCMLGLHPGDADAWTAELALQLNRYIERLRPVAIGEIGIDLYWRQDNLEQQIHAFLDQLALAEELNLPAVIHMRSADDEMLEVLEGAASLPRLHFHSFDGRDDLRQWILDHDSTVGVGGLATRKGSENLQRWLSEIPKERVVLETDAPYLKPRGIRGKRNEPAYVVKVAELLAELWGLTLEQVAALTTENAERIFDLPKETA